MKKKKQRDVVVSVLGPSKQSEQDQMGKVLSDFKKKAALSTTVSNRLIIKLVNEIIKKNASFR